MNPQARTSLFSKSAHFERTSKVSYGLFPSLDKTFFTIASELWWNWGPLLSVTPLLHEQGVGWEQQPLVFSACLSLCGTSVLWVRWSECHRTTLFLACWTWDQAFAQQVGPGWKKRAPDFSPALACNRASAAQSWGWWEMLAAFPSWGGAWLGAQGRESHVLDGTHLEWSFCPLSGLRMPHRLSVLTDTVDFL